MTFNNPYDTPDGGGGTWQAPWLASFMALSSVFAAVGMLSQAYLGSSLRLLILGSVVEMGRRLFQWLIVRFQFQYAVTAQFDEGDPAYEWIILFLTQENVWRRSRNFLVNATNSRRKWSVKTWTDPKVQGNAEYVPTYQSPQLFRWRGRWVEIKRSKDGTEGRFTIAGTYQPVASLFITMYTLDMSLMSELVEDARARYVEVNRPNVVIHIADSPQFPGILWGSVKHKVRRPLSSVILQAGVVDTLVRDAQEFIATEDWYVEAGIPHRRGYLLYGPPGTGKTSTIYALAGALNLEIYSLSLASGFVDDSFLQRSASLIPKHAIFLIEDIDCAFASRDSEDEDDEEAMLAAQFGGGGGMYGGRGGAAGRAAAGRGGDGKTTRSLVTLSGLLNVIDGVGSEEGKLFFATTNYIDRLDPALLRPGRIDRKIAYELSTKDQARALFLRFFPESRFPQLASPSPTAKIAAEKKPPAEGQEEEEEEEEEEESTPRPCATEDREAALLAGAGAALQTQTIPALATSFASCIPPGEFSTAELQCYLQGHKTTPREAVEGADAWVAEVRVERDARVKREEERRRRLRARRGQMLMGMQQSVPMTMPSGPIGLGGMQQMQTAKIDSEHAETNAKDSTKHVADEDDQGGSTKSSNGSEFSSYVDGLFPTSEKVMEEETRAE